MKKKEELNEMLKVNIFNDNKHCNSVKVEKTKRKKGAIEKCCAKVPRKMIISFKNPFKAKWDLLPMLLSVYNAMLIPFQFSFGLPFWYLPVNNIIELVLDVVFLIDNILMFFTTARD